MKRILSIILICLVSFTLAWGCSPMPKRDPLKGAEPDAAVFSNGGWAAVQGSWIYYINGMPQMQGEQRYAAISGALCRMKADGTQKAIVSPQVIESFVISGKYIYYTTPKAEKMEIARIKSDGTGYKRIDDTDAGSPLLVVEDSVFYTKERALYKVSDKTSPKLITKTPVMQLAALPSGVIFFTEFIDLDVPGSLYTVINGQVKKILDGAYKIYDTYNGYAYVYSYDDGTISRVSAVGKAEKLMYVGYDAYFINAEANLAATGNWREEAGVYLTTLSDGVQKRISASAAMAVAMYDEWVYYLNAEDSTIWRVKTDGTNEQKLTDTPVFIWNAMDMAGALLFFAPEKMELADLELFAYDTAQNKTVSVQYAGK